MDLRERKFLKTLLKKVFNWEGVSNLDPNQDKTEDTGVTTPTPTTGTDQPAAGGQTPPVAPADQPAVTPEPVGDQPASETPEVPTPEPAPVTPKPTTGEGEGTSGAGTPPAA